MSLSLEEIKHIASLARIELTQEEQEQFRHELSAILAFIDTLNGVDTRGVEPIAGGTTLENSMRPDALLDDALEGKAAALLDAVPEKKETWARVKSVFS